MRNIEHKKYKGLRPKTWASIVFLCLFAAIPAAVGYQTRQYEKSLDKLSHAIQLQARAQVKELPNEKIEENLTLQEQIDKYIDGVFGKHASIAKAIQKAECNPKNKKYPICITDTLQEYSVGIFQINLKAHAAKVPGKTLVEKVEYLKNPFNCVLVAKSIFADSGWGPWSTYKNGAYRNQL